MNLNERMSQLEEMFSEVLVKLDGQTADIANLKSDVARLKSDVATLRTGQLQAMQAIIRQSDNIEFLINGQAALKDGQVALEDRQKALEDGQVALKEDLELLRTEVREGLGVLRTEVREGLGVLRAEGTENQLATDAKFAMVMNALQQLLDRK